MLQQLAYTSSNFPAVPQGGWPTNGTPFSPTVLVVLYYRSKGLGNQGIAIKCGLKDKTVDTYLHMACECLGIGVKELDKLLIVGGELKG